MELGAEEESVRGAVRGRGKGGLGSILTALPCWSLL